MNPEQLRHDLRHLWLAYYRDNRHWLSRMEIWITYKNQRRPLSSFILATVSVLNPQLTKLLPLLVDLNHDPDQMIEALGLNFNPDKALGSLPAGAVLPAPPRHLPSAKSVPMDMGQAVQEEAPMAEAASGRQVTNYQATESLKPVPGDRPSAPSPDQVLQRPSRPIPRSGGNRPTTEVTRRANALDSGCEGRDRPGTFPPRPRRKFTA
ncbi:MAG: DUF5331 domain-containing protein [Cyanophyceae cyanobacterium]